LILHKSCFDTAIINENRIAMYWQPKIPRERKIGKNITIKFDFGAKFREAQKHPITEK